MRRVFAVRFERFENTRMGYGTAAQTEHGGEARRGGVANTLRAHERDLTVAGHISASPSSRAASSACSRAAWARSSSPR